jgi:hypothetical protein
MDALRSFGEMGVWKFFEQVFIFYSLEQMQCFGAKRGGDCWHLSEKIFRFLSLVFAIVKVSAIE